VLDFLKLFEQAGTVVPSSEILKAPKLSVEVVESPESDDFAQNKDYFLDINAQGMKGGQRGKLDGCTIIGTRGNRRQDQPQNDYDIGVDPSGEDKRHLMIKYAQSKYYLRDLGEGNGTFVKLTQPLLLKNGYIISFGDTHMSVAFFQDRGNQGFDRIQLKFIDGPKTDESYEFSSEETILIGRMPTCQIRFDDS
jgi:hypothetical protein